MDRVVIWIRMDAFKGPRNSILSELGIFKSVRVWPMRSRRGKGSIKGSGGFPYQPLIAGDDILLPKSEKVRNLDFSFPWLSPVLL